MDEQLTVKLTHSNTVREKKPYTIYEIEVRSSSTITWIIYKRYSSFAELHDTLQKFLSDNVQMLGAQIKLPTLPPKRLTRLLAAEFVEKRKYELQEYLRACLQVPALLHSDIMLNFLEVPDSVRPMLQPSSDSKGGVGSGNIPTNAAGGALGGKDGGDGGNKFGINSLDISERNVIELVLALRTSQNKVAAIRKFESWYFLSRTRLQPEFIKLLFDGQLSENWLPVAQAIQATQPKTTQNTMANNNNNNNTAGGTDISMGLVHVCGDFRHSRCAARSALYLISRLLDPEKNKDSSLFVDQIANLPSSVLQRLRLNTHILSSRGNRPAAFTIIHILQQFIETRYNVSTTANGTNQIQITLELLVPDTWARQEYLKWLRVKNSQHYHLTQTQHETHQNVALLLRGTSITAYKPLILQGFQKLLQICSREHGWRDVDISDRRDNNGSNNNNNNVSAMVAHSGMASPIIASPEQNAQVSLNATLSYQKDEESGGILLRSCVLFPFSVSKIVNVLTLPELLPLWDEKLHSAAVTQKFDASSDVIHLVYNTNGSFYQHKDFSILRSLTQLQDGSVILLYRSVNIHSCAEIKGYHRCVLPPSGYIISPISPTESLVTLLLQLDHDSVLLYASDLLGESMDIKLSWQNLYQLLAFDQ